MSEREDEHFDIDDEFLGRPKNRTTSIPYWSAPSGVPSGCSRQTRQGGLEPRGRRTRQRQLEKELRDIFEDD